MITTLKQNHLNVEELEKAMANAEKEVIHALIKENDKLNEEAMTASAGILKTQANTVAIRVWGEKLRHSLVRLTHNEIFYLEDADKAVMLHPNGMIMTIKELKITAALNFDIPVEEVGLLWHGKEYQDDETITRKMLCDADRKVIIVRKEKKA
jgi:hypothetical protein